MDVLACFGMFWHVLTSLRPGNFDFAPNRPADAEFCPSAGTIWRSGFWAWGGMVPGSPLRRQCGFVAWSRCTQCMLLRIIFPLIHGRLEELMSFRFSHGFVIEELMGSWVDMQGHGHGHWVAGIWSCCWSIIIFVWRQPRDGVLDRCLRNATRGRSVWTSWQMDFLRQREREIYIYI